MAGLRVGGLASGMDIDQIVGDLMKAERIPLDKLFQKKTTTEWQRDSYRSINAKLNTLHTKLYDDFLAPNSFNKKTVSVSNENVLTATATSAASGSISIQNVSRLASASYGVGSIAEDTASTTTMRQLDPDFSGKNVKLGVLQADGSMKDFDFTFKETDTISDVVKQINNKGAGITAIYDEKSGKLSLGTKASGKSAEGVEIIDRGQSGFFSVLGFSDAEKIASNGQNAKVTINGAEIERNTNNFTVAGFTLTLKETTATGAAAITLNSITDVKSMVDKVKEFVEKYNELISGMNDSLKEKKYRDFPPLTDEQRKDMSEKEQELWDEKAKSGLLRGDSIVSNGLSNMRNAIYGRVGAEDNIIDTLAEMGITTSSSYSDGGKLIINEEKLKAALTENPDQVVKTLTQSGEKSSTGDTRGIVQRLRESMKEFSNAIETKAGKVTSTDQQYTLGKSLIDMNTRISNFQRRLEDIETRYWKQFTAMEQAISKANSQSGYLSQFGQS